MDDDCPCVRAGRECDPELCVGCDARGKGKHRRCQNNDVQQARFKVGFVVSGTILEWALILAGCRDCRSVRVSGVMGHMRRKI